MHSVHLKMVSLFALSCVLTWIGYLGNLIWPSDNWPTMIPIGPLVAALVVIGMTEGRAGLRDWWKRITLFRAPVWVYATAFLIPLAIIMASFGVTIAIGAELAPIPSYGLAEVLVTILLVVTIFGPMTEEISFRGYGLDTLQRRISPLAASLWIGLGVAVWHLPLFLTGDLPLTVLMPLAGVAVVYGWLYRMGGSVWPLVVLHGQLNCVAKMVTGPMMPDAHDQAIYLAILGVFYLAWAALIVRFAGPSLSRQPADPGHPIPV